MASATAAAGGAATAVTANPVLGAAAGAAASQTTDQLLAEFLPAQKEALDTLVERTRAMETMLGAVHSDLRAILDRDWQAALLSIADAAKHPDRAQDELHVARRRLFDAWGSANTNAKRAQISHELSIVYGLLGEPADSRDWLYRSYSDASDGMADSIRQTWALIDALPRVRVRRGSAGSEDELLGVYLSNKEQFQGYRRMYDEGTFKGFVSDEPLLPALDALAAAKAALIELRFSCAVAQMPRPWASSPESVDLSVQVPESHSRELGFSLHGDSQRLTLMRRGWGHPLRSVRRLQEIACWGFELRGLPQKATKVFVTGSSPELGAWNEDLAVPLERDEYSIWTCDLDVYDSRPSKSVKYRYFYVGKRGAPPTWEAGEARRLPSTGSSRHPLNDWRGSYRYSRDSWRRRKKQKHESKRTDE